MELNSAVKNLQYSLIRKVAEEASNYQDVINFTIGDPDIPTPRDIIEDAFKFAQKGHFGYAPTAGGEGSRRLAAEFYNKKFHTHFTHENVLYNIGSSEALMSAIRTITNPGDEIILFAPYYPGYLPMIQLSYAKPVIIDITKNNLKITPELLDKYITDKTKAIIFCNPCNPTGIVMQKDEMDAIVNYLKDKDLFIIADEIYNMINFYGFTSFGIYDEILDKLIITSGFSKAYSMTGWRIGFTIVPKDIRKYFINNTLYNVSSPMTLSLIAAESALKNHPEMPELVAEYKKRAEYMAEGLTKIGFKVIKPQGAFYLFVDYTSFTNMKSMDFALDMLKKAHVAVVPGIAFEAEGYVRISLTLGVDKVKEALKRIDEYVKANYTK